MLDLNQAQAVLNQKLEEAKEKRATKMATVIGNKAQYYHVSPEQAAELLADAIENGWTDTTGKDEWGGVVAAYRDPNFYVDGPKMFSLTVSGDSPTLVVIGGLPGRSAEERGLVANKAAEIEAAGRSSKRRAAKADRHERNIAALMAA